MASSKEITRNLHKKHNKEDKETKRVQKEKQMKNMIFFNKTNTITTNVGEKEKAKKSH
jgi:hypothetical protein